MQSTTVAKEPHSATAMTSQSSTFETEGSNQPIKATKLGMFICLVYVWKKLTGEVCKTIGGHRFYLAKTGCIQRLVHYYRLDIVKKPQKYQRQEAARCHCCRAAAKLGRKEAAARLHRCTEVIKYHTIVASKYQNRKVDSMSGTPPMENHRCKEAAKYHCRDAAKCNTACRT